MCLSITSISLARLLSIRITFAYCVRFGIPYRPCFICIEIRRACKIHFKDMALTERIEINFVIFVFYPYGRRRP